MQHDQSRFEMVPARTSHNFRSVQPASAELSGAGLAPHSNGISARTFRDALGHYASGITIITGIDDEEPIGFTCQSFYSVSAEPPLISFSVQKTSTTYPRIQATRSFAVNVLTQEQQQASDQFARSGTDKWAGIGWTRTHAGNPVINGTMMWLDCDIWAEHDAGDHLIILGKVREMSLPDARSDDPLLYFKGRYRQLSAE